jgi:hypothetical protein
MKKIVRLTEGDLVRIIKKVISENDPKKQKTQPAATSGDVVKLSKLKGKQDLVNELLGYPIKNPDEMFATLKKYGIEPQKNSKFDMRNNDDVNLMGFIQSALGSMNQHFLRYTLDDKVGEFCKSNIVNFSNMCTWSGIKNSYSNQQGGVPYSTDSILYNFQRFTNSRCPLIAMLQDRFGYLPNDTTVSGKFNVLISEYVKKLVAAAGYTC